MYKIGEFSKISGLSIHTLYHYESLGILKPRFVDEHSSYRYYDADQLITINKVLALKDAGCSLSEIAAILRENIRNNELIAMLESKAESLGKYIESEASRLERLRTNIFLIKNGGLPIMNEISIKQVEPILVASVRKTYNKEKESFDAFCESLWETVNQHIQQANTKRTIPCMTMYHSGLYIHTSSPIDMEVMEPITQLIPDNEQVKVYELPFVEKMACIVHKGPFSTIGKTAETMYQWLNENGYSVCGPVREVYHKGEWVTNDSNEYVTELQYPII